MRLRVFITIIGFLALCQPGTYAQPKQAKSTLVFDREVWDFGNIKEEDGPVTYIFKFKNTGVNAIVLESVSSSCGCTTPKYSKAPILPGKSGELTVTFDPDQRPGMFSKDVHIISNGGKNRNTVTVKGEVKPRPRSIQEDYPYAFSDGVRLNNMNLNLRYTGQGSGHTTAFGYANNSKKDAKVSFVVEPSDGNVRITAPETICAGCKNEAKVTVTIPKGGHYGKYVYRIFPVVNGKRESLSLSVSGIATDDFTGVDETKAAKADFSSFFHNFGVVKQGTRHTQEFKLTNTGKEPLIIRNVTAQANMSADLKEGSVIQPGKSVKIKCTLNSAGASGVLTQVVSIITNDPVRPLREIRLAATVE